MDKQKLFDLFHIEYISDQKGLWPDIFHSIFLTFSVNDYFIYQKLLLKESNYTNVILSIHDSNFTFQ